MRVNARMFTQQSFMALCFHTANVEPHTLFLFNSKASLIQLSFTLLYSDHQLHSLHTGQKSSNKDPVARSVRKYTFTFFLLLLTNVSSKYLQTVSSHRRFELSLLTALLATHRYQPVWFRLTSVTLMMLLFPCAKAVMLPLRVSCCHTYWIGPVPFSRLQRIHIVDPSTGEASLTRRLGLLTGTAFKTRSKGLGEKVTVVLG